MKQILSPLKDINGLHRSLFFITPHVVCSKTIGIIDMSRSPPRLLPFDIFSDSLLGLDDDESEETEINKTKYSEKEDDAKKDGDGAAEGDQIHVDFFTKLGIDNSFPNIIGLILSYLSPQDLMQITCVTKNWKHVTLNDTKARERKEKYLAELKELKDNVGQENWPIKKKTPAPDKPPLERSAFKTLTYCQKSERKDCGEDGSEHHQAESSFSSTMSSIVRPKAKSCPPKHLSSSTVTAMSKAQQNINPRLKLLVSKKKLKPKRLKIAEDEVDTAANGNSTCKSIAGSKSSRKNLKRL